MLYGRVATGTQPGAPPLLLKETLTDYEMGLKSRLLDHRLLADITVFDIIRKNIQLDQSNICMGTCGRLGCPLWRRPPLGRPGMGRDIGRAE